MAAKDVYYWPVQCNTSLTSSYNTTASLSFLNLRKLSGRDLGPTNGSFVGELSYIVLETRSKDVDHSVLTRELTGALQDALQSA